jgi:hypothetical protein
LVRQSTDRDPISPVSTLAQLADVPHDAAIKYGTENEDG